MTGGNWMWLGCRLLGIYFLVWGFAAIPEIYGIYLSAQESEYADPTSMAMIAGSRVAVLILASFFLLFWKPEGDHQSPELSEGMGLSMTLGIRLVGLVFAFQGLVEAVSTVTEILVTPGWRWYISKVLGAFISLFGGTILVLRPGLVAKWIGDHGLEGHGVRNESSDSG